MKSYNDYAVYATFAGLAYQEINYIKTGQNRIPLGWKYESSRDYPSPTALNNQSNKSNDSLAIGTASSEGKLTEHFFDPKNHLIVRRFEKLNAQGQIEEVVYSIRGTASPIDVLADAALSTKEGYAVPQDLCEYFLAQLKKDKSKKISTVKIVGHSLGGYIAIKLALAFNLSQLRKTNESNTPYDQETDEFAKFGETSESNNASNQESDEFAELRDVLKIEIYAFDPPGLEEKFQIDHRDVKRVTVFLANPNPVNCLHRHTGREHLNPQHHKQYKVFLVPNGNEKAHNSAEDIIKKAKETVLANAAHRVFEGLLSQKVPDFLKRVATEMPYVLDQHSIDNIASRMSQARDNNMGQVKKWPSLIELLKAEKFSNMDQHIEFHTNNANAQPIPLYKFYDGWFKPGLNQKLQELFQSFTQHKHLAIPLLIIGIACIYHFMQTNENKPLSKP